MIYQEEFERWLAFSKLTEEEHRELLEIANNEDLKKLRFSDVMSFGTAGLRSTMYMGTANMNRFTVAQTTRALAYLVKQCAGESRGVVIAYDSRNNSELFARVSASVLAYEGIKVYIFNGIRPTPELSFALRNLGAIAGINITASHNPKEYNGYKAYWEDGAQIGPEQAAVISEERDRFDVLDESGMFYFDRGVEKGIISILDSSFDDIYVDAVLSTAIEPDNVKKCADELKIVYSPLHGAGYKLVPRIFREIGIKHLYTVDSQMTPDGNFPTVEKPNPEYKEVFSHGIAIADNMGSDIVIATDPDADRVGVMVRASSGEFVTLTGNQMGALLLDYVIGARKRLGKLPRNAYAVKSIVSTDMAYRICEMNGVKLHDVLTGFKFIGEVIKNYEEKGEDDGFILGFEESYGYLLGSYARDKDAVEASMMILEMTAYYKLKNMTLYDALMNLYGKYGNYRENVIEIYMEGLDGIERRKRTMSSLRTDPPKELGGVEIKSRGDYLTSKTVDLITGEIFDIHQHKSDVLYYTLKNDDKIIIRPSGTEPKIKIYVLAHDDDAADLDEKIKKYNESAKKLVKS